MNEPGARVLVVEDRPDNAVLVKAVLERAGHRVDWVEDGPKALAALAQAPPDIVLLDVMMPGMDGYEVCRRIKADHATASIPVVMVTALHEHADRMKGLEAGADEFLSKPVDRAELLVRVRSLVRQKRLNEEVLRSRDELAGQAYQLAAEKATAERERAVLAAVMGSMSEGLLVADAQGRVTYVNPQARTILGIPGDGPPDQTIAQLFEQLLPHVEAPDELSADARRAWGQVEDEPWFEFALAGPPRRDLRVQFFPVKGQVDGPAKGVLLRDVTAEREADRLKDELMSIVSHELRTPLASLVGFAELLLVRDFGEAERREFLTIMLEEGRRLTSLINDFLDLQRMETGRQILEMAPVGVATLVSRALTAAGEDATHPTVLDVPDDLPLVVADADRVQQVLLNLISNARKYAPGGGEVRIRARERASEMELVVADKGLGIPPEALPKLFEKFYRVDNSDRREIKGTGLGLAICQQIISAHGGRVWAESDGLGHGSRFMITLPLADAEPVEGDVLIVEDDRGFARLLEAELAQHHLSAYWAASAEAALERVRAMRPRAIVLDLLLPGINGEEFLPRLRQLGGHRTPVVVVTVKDLHAEERHRLEQAGAVAVLRKGPGVAARAAEAVSQSLPPQAREKELVT